MRAASTGEYPEISADKSYEAVLLVSFGGPEGTDDVIPFLENVTAARGIPAERLAAVAEQYYHVGGVSPLNEQCRQLRAALAAHLSSAGFELPVYWGNRNWTPLIADTLAEIAADGHRSVLAVMTSPYSSYSGCRQYLEDIAEARSKLGSEAPIVDKVRAYYDHPGFVEPFIESAAEARNRLPVLERAQAILVATAHSIPESMAQACDYEQQLQEVAQLVASGAGFDSWALAWQSRSGSPETPWLEPDVNEFLASLAADTKAVVLAPIGFVTDHMEVIWDLDVIAAKTAAKLGISISRAVTPGSGPDERFVAMWAELIQERLAPRTPRRGMGSLGARPDVCPPGCCPKTSQSH